MVNETDISDQKPKRPRIPFKAPAAAIQDKLEFVKNMCSDNARLVVIHPGDYKTEIWFDKHYYHRHHSGDGGIEREGIDPHTIEEYICRSIPYLVQFSTIVKDFNFVNYAGDTSTTISIVLRFFEGDEAPVNLVIIPHFVELGRYQITVKTAMKEENFKIWSGQYYIDFQDDRVDLFHFQNKTPVLKCTI